MYYSDAFLLSRVTNVMRREERQHRNMSGATYWQLDGIAQVIRDQHSETSNRLYTPQPTLRHSPHGSLLAIEVGAGNDYRTSSSICWKDPYQLKPSHRLSSWGRADLKGMRLTEFGRTVVRIVATPDASPLGERFD